MVQLRSYYDHGIAAARPAARRTRAHQAARIAVALGLGCFAGPSGMAASYGFPQQQSRLKSTERAEHDTRPAKALPWMSEFRATDSIEQRLMPPADCARTPAKDDTFAAWLRGLPLKPGTPPVHLHNGELKANQSAHAAVIDIDVGARDLQQCADAVIRLRAEFLWSAGRSDQIAFHFTSGDLAEYRRWADGVRPRIQGARVTWEKSAKPDRTYAGFRKYLDTVFTYAGTASLERELIAVAADDPVRAGDVFIKGGSPGHAVIVVDVAEKAKSGERVFLLAQSYMPAQEIQILKNPRDERLSPWYASNFGEELVTPEWTFSNASRRRFRE